MLSTKPGKEAYVEPVIEGGGYRFTVKMGSRRTPRRPTMARSWRAGRTSAASCRASPIAGDHIKAEGKAGRMGARLMAIVAEGDRGRVYLAPTPEHEVVARQAQPAWRPEITISGSTQYLGVQPYGIERFDQLYTDRQLVALTTFSDLVQEAREQVQRDAHAAGLPDDGHGLDAGGTGAIAYADAVAVYVAFARRPPDAARYSTLALWSSNPAHELVVSMFSRQALSMTWDYRVR